MTSKETWKELLIEHSENNTDRIAKHIELEKANDWNQYFCDGMPIERSQLRALQKWVSFLQEEWVESQSTIFSILMKLAKEEDK